MSADHGARSGGIIGISFRCSFNMKLCCVFSLGLPHGGNSNKYTQYTISNIKKMKITLNYPKSAAIGFFSKRLKNKFETAVAKQAISVRATEGLL